MCGDHPDLVIEVEIGENKSVAMPKDAIKEKLKPDLNHVTARFLTLWNVSNKSILADEEIQDHIDVLDLEDETSLSPLKLLGAEFSRLEQKHVHVVVEPPEPGE
jgi:hypothetical protein